MAKGFYVEGVHDLRVCLAMQKKRRLETKEAIRKKRWARKNHFLKTSVFICQLYRGSNKFPRTKALTCMEMGMENRFFVKKFIKAMDDGKDHRLYVWKIIDTDAFKTALYKSRDI